MQPNTESNPGGFYTQPQQTQFVGGTNQPEHQAALSTDAVEWDASEYIHHEKGAAWGVVVGAVALVSIGVAVWLRQWILALLLAVMAVVFAMYGFKRPRTLHYRLTDDAVVIADKTYQLADYKAFGVISDGPLYSIILLPIRRFGAAVTMYIPEAEGERIVDILGSQLPMQEVHADPFEHFMRKLRF